jgi:hypothetical protein
VQWPLEISPLYALDGEEVVRKVNRQIVVSGATYLQ